MWVFRLSSSKEMVVDLFRWMLLDDGEYSSLDWKVWEYKNM